MEVRPVEGNRKGRFLSVPTEAADGTEIGFPLTIEYALTDDEIAEIMEVFLAVVRGGSVIGETENLLTGGVTAADGKIEFKNLVLPVFQNITTNGGRIGLSIQLKGTIDGESVETKRGDVNVKFKDGNNFTPLYLAEVDIVAADRRYGQVSNERGDDNWALASTIEWLIGEEFRFNDISAQHVAQTANGRSILDHSGHSDGSQIDLRYQDPTGTFADGGTANVNNALVSAAFTEFQAANGQTTAQERLASWIKLNRAAIEDAAGDARRIYIANGTVGRALSAGEYTDGSDILDLPTPPNQASAAIGDWTNRPEIAMPESDHVNHWHIALD